MNGKIALVLILGISFLFFGCVGDQAPQEPVTPPVTAPETGDDEPLVGGDKDEHGCIGSAGYTWCEIKQKCLRVWEEPCVEGSITLDEAKAIAEASSCRDEGNLTDDAPTYNNVTHTWWFDMDIVKEGCAPACVVDEATKTAEINWRCTGLIPPEGNETGEEAEPEEETPTEEGTPDDKTLAGLFEVEGEEPLGDEGLTTDTPISNSS